MKQICLVVFTVLATIGNAQTVNGKLHFQKGQKFEVYTQLNRSSQQEMMGRSMESSVSSAITAVLNVDDVAGAATTLGSSVRRLKFDMSFFGREENFDSDNAEDMKSDIGKMMAKPLNTKYQMILDEKGVVTAAKELEADGKKKGNDQAAGMMGMFMGNMNVSGTPKAGDPSIFKILPDREVAKGESWTDDVKDANGTRKTVYSLSNITDSEILIDFTEDAKMDMKQEMMGQQAAMSINSKSNGKIVLDKTTGLLKQKTFVTHSEETINAGGMTIPSNSKMTTTITVKAL